MTGHGDKDWTEELEQDENRGQDVPDNFEKRVKEVLENNEIKDFPTFDLWEEETNEDGNANP